MFREDYTKILLIMGEHDIYNHRQPFPMEGRKVKKIITHPKFDLRSFENDLALLELDSPVEYQPHILPACLPEEDHQMEGLLGWVTGWGKIRKGWYLHIRICFKFHFHPIRRPYSISSPRTRSPNPK